MNVLGMMRKEFNVDPRRIYLTGHSMGGAGTLFLAAKHADLWAAAAPVAPASFMMNNTRADILKSIKDAGLPLLIVQGDADTVVAPSNTRMWADTAKELALAGLQVRRTARHQSRASHHGKPEGRLRVLRGALAQVAARHQSRS